jgi:hypothetical protein
VAEAAARGQRAEPDGARHHGPQTERAIANFADWTDKRKKSSCGIYGEPYH